jgi:DNA-binding MarR family transcriptional regulator
LPTVVGHDGPALRHLSQDAAGRQCVQYVLNEVPTQEAVGVDQVKRAEYVERWARMNEAQGEPRIGGRIYAHLATAPEPFLSLQELADQLSVSRASVSTNTRRLIERGMISRVAVPGSRGEHYAADAVGTRAILARVAEQARALEALAEEGVDLQPGVVTPGTQSLRAMSDIFRDMAETLDRLAADAGRRTRSSKRVAQ